MGVRTQLLREIGCSVIAIEPQEKCVERLRTQFGADARVHIVRKGLGARPGTAALHICEDAYGICTFSDRWRTEGRFCDDASVDPN